MNGVHFVYAVLAGLVPPLVWMFFWLREDHTHPEPRSLLFSCFMGGVVAVFCAIPLEKYAITLFSDPTRQYIAWAAIEEVVKFLAIWLVALRTRYYDEPIDAMIYMIAAALGFAALENIMFIMGPFADGRLAEGIVTGNMRFIGATLVHVVSSALIGFGIGLAFYKAWIVRVLGGLVGLAGAVAIHASFNLAIINAGPVDVIKTFGWVWGAVVIVIVLFEEIKAVGMPRGRGADGAETPVDAHTEPQGV